MHACGETRYLQYMLCFTVTPSLGDSVGDLDTDPEAEQHPSPETQLCG